jgi:hypothetical protein
MAKRNGDGNMHFNDLLQKYGISPAGVLIVRHRAWESELHKWLPYLAGEKPALFNAYQQTQLPHAERAFTRAKYLASFIGTDPGIALFVGLFEVKGFKAITNQDWWKTPACRQLHECYGMDGLEKDRKKLLWFDLELKRDFYPSFNGRLIIKWHGGERAWRRWAEKNAFEISAIRESNGLERIMPPWEELVVSWNDLKNLPLKWRDKLSEWRGIYYIMDASDNKGYVGAAYGTENILGRWENYAKSGHGGNVLLIPRRR